MDTGWLSMGRWSGRRIRKSRIKLGDGRFVIFGIGTNGSQFLVVGAFAKGRDGNSICFLLVLVASNACSIHTSRIFHDQSLHMSVFICSTNSA